MKVDPIYSPEVLALMSMTDEVVPASALAPIVKMHPSVIIEYAKRGQWDLCKYVRSGNRYKFFRKDFLQRCGFIEKQEDDIPTQLLAELKAIRELLAEFQERRQNGHDQAV